MTDPVSIDAVAAVIESELGEHVDGSSVARALADAGWLRTAEDRAVLDAAEANTAARERWISLVERPEGEWSPPAGSLQDAARALSPAAEALDKAVRARRGAAAGTEAQP